MDHQAIEEVAQELVATGHVIGMIFLAEEGAELAFAYFKIHELKDGDDVIVLKLECYAQLFQYIVIAKHLSFTGQR